MIENIPAVILCGGMGTRLREETEFRPKPMVKIGNRPILWHIMKIYAHYGVKRFILSLGYKGEMIKEYFFNYEIMNSSFTMTIGSQNACCIHNSYDEKGWQITLCDTGDNALKGARLKRIEQYVNSDYLFVTYGDGVANIDIENLFNFHKSHGKVATVTGVRPKFLRFGELDIYNDRVIRFSEKPSYEGNYVNGGFFVFSRQIFNYLEDRDDCDLETGALEIISREGNLMVYKHDKFWACMDTIRDVDYLNTVWDKNKAEWKIW
jgi:glucose-1-phosphate cytidylyltransferase